MVNPSRNIPGTDLKRTKSGGLARLLRAAENGDAGAQFNLGVFYDNSLDDNHHSVGGKRADSIKWLLKAARQGLPRAQSKLAELYVDGPEAPKHDVPAHAWFTLAAKNSTGADRHRAEFGYTRVALRMTPAQLSQATRLAHDWTPKPHVVATPATAGNFPEKGTR